MSFPTSDSISKVTLAAAATFFLLSYQLSAQVTLSGAEGDWSLMVDGEPFEVKGVTFGYQGDANNYPGYFEELQSMGVNTIRIWATDENTMALLDAAHSYGIKVMVGIWMRHGRPGMEADDRFDYLSDDSGKEAMYENAIQTVETYKEHPAVLIWGIGNEVYLNIATDQEKEAYSILLERICSRIKELDKQHPIASVEAWTFGIEWWEKWVPSLDIYGINCYGPGAAILPDEFQKQKVEKPYVITEFGVTGEWDVPEDANGIPVEPSDHQKYQANTTGYQEWIDPKPSCLGVYFFHYADGDEFTAPWLFTRFQGMNRPQYWAIREAFSGKTPANYPPEIESLKMPSGSVQSGKWVPVTLIASDKDQDELSVSFFYNQRTGSRKRRDQLVPLVYRGTLEGGLEIQMPNENGPIKVYATIADTYPNVAIATTSIVVEDEIAKKRKYLVPKAKLPFYVYRDGAETNYIPSGYMGNIEAIRVDLKQTEEVHSGRASLMIGYDARDNWYGVGFVDPPNDWGDMLGGFDLSGARKLSFWAKADDQVKATIGFGLIEADKPYPDTAKKSEEFVLTSEWRRYSISLKKLDLSCIRSGLVVFSSGQGFPHKIYLDEVVFE